MLAEPQRFFLVHGIAIGLAVGVNSLGTGGSPQELAERTRFLMKPLNTSIDQVYDTIANYYETNREDAPIWMLFVTLNQAPREEINYGTSSLAR
jgi:hypothetical protein